MSEPPPVVVEPPGPSGGRRVRVDGRVLGTAFSLRDVTAFLQEAGLQGWDELDVAASGLIDWRGGGPDAWAES
ncbi:hypothetical protein [Streptomyces fragilis]|uniref:Uncharacterized protein n=1 Tax=Streptomyces fragilis TaxID=67301 RepID=A0ABV2YPG5_9ACTN|nr:hypothetical protein [Streptomyces fragilis]